MTPIDKAMAVFTPGLPFAVGLSGGADSTALLLACARRWPGHIRAFHVHHGLQSAADDFELHCHALCARLNVPLTVHRVDARHASGDSPEDAARRARYAALTAMAAQEALADIALGHHADDQAETVLLALSRGAGLAGLAAMPAQTLRDGMRYHRPLLGLAGTQIRAWLSEQGESWIEDPSNGDTRYTRNRIRQQVLPAIEQAFPQFRATFARSAAHAAQAQGLLVELARQDLDVIGMPPEIAALRQLSRARQANVLRHWLLHAYACTPSTVQLEELLDQLETCTTRGHRLHLKLGSGFVRRVGAVLDWYNDPPLPNAGRTAR